MVGFREGAVAFNPIYFTPIPERQVVLLLNCLSELLIRGFGQYRSMVPDLIRLIRKYLLGMKLGRAVDCFNE